MQLIQARVRPVEGLRGRVKDRVRAGDSRGEREAFHGRGLGCHMDEAGISKAEHAARRARQPGVDLDANLKGFHLQRGLVEALVAQLNRPEQRRKLVNPRGGPMEPP